MLKYGPIPLFYFASACKSPIPVDFDPVARNATSPEIQWLASVYHTYQPWLAEWSDFVGDNRTSSDLQHRPKPSGSIWDNTTVTGSWIETKDSDVQEISTKYGRMINNITMAMPHGGIPGAAMDKKNKIPQPNDISGEVEGKYNLEATVPSPAVNVLCVGMNESEISPLVYDTWPDADFNATSWMASPPENIPRAPSWLNSTVVDNIFGFGEKYGQRPPIFGTLPEANNTISNITGLWPSSAIYLLGKPSRADPPYVLCSIRTRFTGVCSTRYRASPSGAVLSSNCEDPKNHLQYNYRNPDFQESNWQPDWKNVASMWANSLSLGSGIINNEGSNSRLLMQMVPAYDSSTKRYSLSEHFPSTSETLAVMASTMLIYSSKDAPFIPEWNYTTVDDVLVEPVYQYFKASLQFTGYASGSKNRWQGVFYVILLSCFITSFICFGFMIFEARGHQVTDFTEPQNLFALAMNSPYSSRLKGACGSGPVGRQLKERWLIGMAEEEAHYYIRARTDGQKLVAARRATRSRTVEQMSMDDQSMSLEPVRPAVDEYRRVSERDSFLGRFY